MAVPIISGSATSTMFTFFVCFVCFFKLSCNSKRIFRSHMNFFASTVTRFFFILVVCFEFILFEKKKKCLHLVEVTSCFLSNQKMSIWTHAHYLHTWTLIFFFIYPVNRVNYYNVNCWKIIQISKPNKPVF